MSLGESMFVRQFFHGMRADLVLPRARKSRV
jgi:hypothetical protein